MLGIYCEQQRSARNRIARIYKSTSACLVLLYAARHIVAADILETTTYNDILLFISSKRHYFVIKTNFGSLLHFPVALSKTLLAYAALYVIEFCSRVRIANCFTGKEKR